MLDSGRLFGYCPVTFGVVPACPDKGGTSLLRNLIRVLVTVAVATAVCGVARAADIIEPWDPGFSNLELFAVTGDQPGDSGFVSVVGFGIGRGYSLGATLESQGDGTRRSGLIAMASCPLTSRSDLDLWLESGVQSPQADAELRTLDWGLGAQWRLRLPSCTPYLRASRGGGGEVCWHFLAGVMIPVGEVELHLELSSEEPDGGPWPVHLAVGPNVCLASDVELQPELSLIRDRGTGYTHWSASVCVVLNPAGMVQRQSD
jgi:hypothetical protein